jgi:hypothetical protein
MIIVLVLKVKNKIKNNLKAFLIKNNNRALIEKVHKIIV